MANIGHVGERSELISVSAKSKCELGKKVILTLVLDYLVDTGVRFTVSFDHGIGVRGAIECAGRCGMVFRLALAQQFIHPRTASAEEQRCAGAGTEAGGRCTRVVAQEGRLRP